MAGISTTGTGLPTPASLFDAAANTQQPGVLVQGDRGSTALPPASPSDFQGENPTPLDQPHPQYPTLIQSHVAVLQAIGTPEAVIVELANQQPQAEYLDRYIQAEIMQNPEGWDSYVGNPAGTARAGLQQLMPNVQLPAPGAGRPGYMPDGSAVHGINVPGLSTPLLNPTTGAPEGNGGGLLTGVLVAAAVLGIGFLGWKFLKNRNAGTDAAKQAVQALAGSDAAIAGGGNAIEHMGRQLMSSGIDAKDVGLVQRGLSLGVFGGGASGGGAAAAATAESIMKGMGPANGFINSAGISALHFDMPMSQAINAALADRYMGVLEMATKSGQLADFAATQVAMKQALTGAAPAAAVAGGAGNTALRNLLAAAANAIPV